MNLNELNEFLKQYTEVELFNKSKYYKSHYGASYNYAWELHPNDSALQPEPVQKENWQFFIITGLTDILPEQKYFKADHDIALIKHDRYAYPFVHKHNFFEIIYCISGAFEHELAGEKRAHKAGELCFISPGVQHAVHVFNDSIVIDILVKCSTFDQAFRPMIGKRNVLSDFFTSSLYGKDQKSALIFDTKEDLLIRDRILNMLNEEYEDLPYNGEVLDHEIMLLFYDLLRRFSDSTISIHFENTENDRFAQVLEYIHTHFNTVTLDDLAKEFYFNKSYLSRVIKEKTGKNFTELVKDIRLKVAEELLAHTTLPLLEISNMVGYSDSSHLFRLFKQQYGLNPKEYRKQFREPAGQGISQNTMTDGLHHDNI